MSRKNQATAKATGTADRWIDVGTWALGSASAGVLRAGSATLDWGAELIDRLQGLEVPDRASKLASTGRKRWQELDVPERAGKLAKTSRKRLQELEVPERAGKLAKTGQELSDSVTEASPAARTAMTVLAIIGAITVLRIVLKMLGWMLRKLFGSKPAETAGYGPQGTTGGPSEGAERGGSAFEVPREQEVYAETTSRTESA